MTAQRTRVPTTTLYDYSFPYISISIRMRTSDNYNVVSWNLTVGATFKGVGGHSYRERATGPEAVF